MQEKELAQWSKFCKLLNGCAKKKDLLAGRCIHLVLVRSSLDREALLVDHLIRFYTACGSLQEAHQIFCNTPVRSVYTWNAIMSAHMKLGNGVVAMRLYVDMICGGVEPDKVTFLCITRACTDLGALEEGRLMHAHIFHYAVHVDEALGSALVTFYASFRCLVDAGRVFYSVCTKDVVLWGVIIAAYAQHSDTAALELFDAMLIRGHTPSHFILNCIFKVCASLKDVRHLHELIIKNGFESDLIIGSSLVNAYARFGNLDVAYSVFRVLPKHDVISWGALINGYAQQDRGVSALHLFCQMQQENVKPDQAIFLSVLEGCAQVVDFKLGKVLHDRIIKSGFYVGIAMMSSLVNMYMACGSILDGRSMFDAIPDRDVVSWGALLAGFVQQGDFQNVMELFHEMQEERIEPDKVILQSLLKACGGLRESRKGWLVHDHIVRRDFEGSIDIGNGLVSMYVANGSLEEACRVFDMLPKRNEVTWGAMITGYVKEGDVFAAFELLNRMVIDGLKPDDMMFLSALKACAIAGVARNGMLLHDQVIRNGLDMKPVVFNMLVHVYASCKRLDEALRVFGKMPEKDVVSWSALITGLASAGKCKQAEELLVDMQREGLKPDDTTYTILLSAYTRNGLLKEGLQFHRKVRHRPPTVVHVNCLMDLFCRMGRLNEAKEISQAMPYLPDLIARTALLTSSNTFGSTELGRHCFDQAAGPDLMSDASSVVCASSDEGADLNEANQAQEILGCFNDLSHEHGNAHSETCRHLLPEGRRCIVIGVEYCLGRAYLQQEHKLHSFCTITKPSSQVSSFNSYFVDHNDVMSFCKGGTVYGARCHGFISPHLVGR